MRALDFKGEFRRFGFCSVSATIDSNWSIFLCLLSPDRHQEFRNRREAIYYLVKIEVEVDTPSAKEKLVVEVDAVLLDNISPDDLKRGVAMIGGHAINEASGRVTPETASAIAERASTPSPSGWLTHRAPIPDIGLDAA